MKEEKRDDGQNNTRGQNQTSSSNQGRANGNGRPLQTISYSAERVIGNGSFGVVYQATVVESRETVAIKKVLQDQRFKNRELQIMTLVDHPNVISLKHCFYSTGEQPNEIYLNLVMEYVPETVFRTVRNHTKAKKYVPLTHVRCYMYQICRSLAHIHSLGICHRDIKPQNLLLNPRSHVVKLCDFGSAKILVPGEPNVSYICSRYYRAPELVCEAVEYTTAVDVWSLGCVMAELLLGTPIFPGESSYEQLTEIIKTLGTPSAEDLKAMNPNYKLNVAAIQPLSWSKIFRDRAPPDALDLVSQFLCYNPNRRPLPILALTHEFFDELRKEDHLLPNGHPPPNIHNWTKGELELMAKHGIANKLIPPHIAKEMTKEQLDLAKYVQPTSSLPTSSSGKE